MEGAGGGSGSGLLPRSDHQSQHSQLFGVSQPDISTPPLTVDAISDSQQVEAASPISSRPPAPSSLNYEELIRLSSGGGQMAVEDDALVGEEADRSGGGGGSGGTGNRWPRQETLALLKIRSDMDSAFRDATLKGPLWDEVSRKLGEMGYKRSAKKCKEKFENVQKYYKRTKEGRGGRQDGKTYKFFTQLEALHNAASVGITTNTATSTPLNVAPSSFGISNPTPISSVKIISSSSQTPMGIFSPLPDHFTFRPPSVAAPPMGISFSSNTSSASTEDEDEDEDDDEETGGFDVDLEGEPSSTNVAGTSRKRRRGAVKKGSSSSGRSRSHKMMMEFFEGLMKQVLEKQEGMQHKFLEAIEKREQDRMIREETWKRQEMARLSREQERMAQERTISASRDAAIIALLQKFTGQTIQLPTVNIPSPTPQQQYDVPMPVAMPVPVPVPAPASTPLSVPVPLSPVPPPPLQPQTSLPQQQIQKTQLQNQPPSNTMPLDHHHHPMISSSSSSYQEISQGGGDGPSAERIIISSRWPKPEVLALIKLRGGLESRYQENGPKGPLWEEISSGMQRMGYKRSAKRCKEKWENINKYFKKVKESNKKRREDSKTCPYFNELDALYRKKNLLGAGGGSDDTAKFEQDPIINMAPSSSDHAPETPHSSIPQPQSQSQSQTTQLAASLFGEGAEEQPAEATKPEDIVNELMELQDLYRPASTNDVNNHQDEEEHEEEEEEEENEEGEQYCSDDDDDIPEEKRPKNNKMDYKIEFQRRNVGNSNGVASEFKSMAVV